MIVQACLNGSRAIGFHQRLPLTSEDIANDGASCIAAGAAELHLHPRSAHWERKPGGRGHHRSFVTPRLPRHVNWCVDRSLGSRTTKFIPAIASPAVE